jgi:hypothetical protein
VTQALMDLNRRRRHRHRLHAVAAEQAIPDHPTGDELEAMPTEIPGVVSNYIAQRHTITAEDAAFLASRVRFGGPRDAALVEIQRRDAHLHANAIPPTTWDELRAGLVSESRSARRTARPDHSRVGPGWLAPKPERRRGV